MGRSGRTDRWLEAAFRLHPGELRSTLVLFLQLGAVVFAYVVARAVRDALFLSRLSPAQLPGVYVLAALGVALAGAFQARHLAHRRPDRVIPATALVFAFSLALARAALGRGGAAVDVAL